MERRTKARGWEGRVWVPVGENERSDTKRPDKREPLFVRYLLKGQQQGRGKRDGKTGCYTRRTDRRLSFFPSRGFRIVRRGSSPSIPLNRKPDAGPFASATQHYQPAVSHRRLPARPSQRSRLCQAEYHLPCRGVYYAALKPGDSRGAVALGNLSTNVTRRGFLSLGFYLRAARLAFP